MRSYTPGETVRVTFDDGAEDVGQVWGDSPRDGYVWVALASGRYVLVSIGTGYVVTHNALGEPGTKIGRVAA